MYAQEKIKPYGQEGDKGRQVEQMFDGIAHSYDQLNHLLSLGIDRGWRRKTMRALLPYAPQEVLDIATGTGDFALLAARTLRPKRIVGADLSEGMMDIARQKAEKAGLGDIISFQREDCLNLSFADNSFDAVTVAYGVRNYSDLDRGLREMLRVLKPGGHVAILELAVPRRFPMKQLFWLYSHAVMPLVGRLVSKDRRAYKYLPQTMEAFPQGEVMQGIMERAGFREVRFKRFTCGLSTMYVAEKEKTPSQTLPHNGEGCQADSERNETRDIYGLIGFPLVHSFSKKYFTEKFEREGICAQYLNFEMESVDGLIEMVRSNPQLKGLNVTIPHKQNVLKWLTHKSDGVREIGACNCIKIERAFDGTIYLLGHNTDVIGFERSIGPLLKPWHKRALVLGTGGASKAVVYALRKMGVEPTLVSRKPSDGRITYQDLDEETMREHTVVVNCTPLGTYPKVEACPDIPYIYIGESHLLYDLVYNPEKTLFLQRGEAQGAAVKNGLEMLHLQAEAGWEIWNR